MERLQKMNVWIQIGPIFHAGYTCCVLEELFMTVLLNTSDKLIDKLIVQLCVCQLYVNVYATQLVSYL